MVHFGGRTLKTFSTGWDLTRKGDDSRTQKDPSTKVSVGCWENGDGAVGVVKTGTSGT